MEEPKTDINELFARDPLSLTDEDIDEIIAHFRAKRHLFKENPGAAKTPKKPKLTKKEQEVGGLNLDLKL